jgi:hypothetical protein
MPRTVSTIADFYPSHFTQVIPGHFTQVILPKSLYQGHININHIYVDVNHENARRRDG